jgi:hypothetical protein
MENAKEPQNNPVKISEEQKQKIEEAEKKFQNQIDERLEQCEYQKINDRQYAFIFEKKRFVFHTPNLLENTRIKAILAEVTSFPGASNQFGSTYKINTSADMDLICSTKLLTHTAILRDEPEDFNPDDLDDIQQMDLGYTIFAAEFRFLDEKKKASINGQ